MSQLPDGRRYIDPAESAKSPLITGLDVNGLLRIRLAYDKAQRQILAKWSGDSVITDPCPDVQDYIGRLRQQLGYAEQWLIQWRRQHGEEMERPLPPATPGEPS